MLPRADQADFYRRAIGAVRDRYRYVSRLDVLCTEKDAAVLRVGSYAL